MFAPSQTPEEKGVKGEEKNQTSAIFARNPLSDGGRARVFNPQVSTAPPSVFPI
jgi:hypothetical protein